MRRWIAALAAGALVALAGGAARAETLGYTSFWVFGDSLSDPGNLDAATGGAIPGAPYWRGRYSNGRVWAEGVAAGFAARGLPSANYAHGGAAAVGPPPLRPLPAPPVLDLADQLARFEAEAAGRLGARPVASLLIGANDLIFGGVPLGTAALTGRRAAREVGAAARRLGAFGVRDVALFSLPALDQTPAYALLQPELAPEAARGTAAFNRALSRQGERLEARGMRVIEVDLAALFAQLLDDPAAFGVADATRPCHVQGVFTCDLATEAPLLAFFDGVHPNATIHAGIAERVGAEIRPVPLPAPAALLLAAVGALAATGAWRRRRAAR